MSIKMRPFWHLNCVLLLNWIVWNKNVFTFNSVYYPKDWGCRIHQLVLCRGVRSPPPPNESPGYDTKQYGDEVPVMLELWGIRITPSLPSLVGPLWAWVMTPDRILSIGQIELNCVIMLNWITCHRTILIFKLRTYAKRNCLK